MTEQIESMIPIQPLIGSVVILIRWRVIVFLISLLAQNGLFGLVNPVEIAKEEPFVFVAFELPVEKCQCRKTTKPN